MEEWIKEIDDQVLIQAPLGVQVFVALVVHQTESEPDDQGQSHEIQSTSNFSINFIKNSALDS